MSETVARKLRLNTNIDLVNGGSTRSQKFILPSVSKVLPITIDIQNYAAGNRVLCGRIANNKTITDERENRRIQTQLSNDALPGLDNILI